jgi:prevent-host-death family protein
MEDDVGVRELKERLSAYLERVEEGESVTITRHGKPVARLVPYSEPLAEKLEDLRQRGIIYWSGKKLEYTLPTIEPDGDAAEGQTLSDLIIEDR